MPEVVGSAFVRIKALTDKLGRDIEKSVKKGMKDAKLDKVGDEAGDELGTSMGDSTADSFRDSLKKNSKGGFLPDDFLDDVNNNVRKHFKELDSEFDNADFDFTPNFDRDGDFARNIDRQSDAIRNSLTRLRNLRPDPDEFDLLPDNVFGVDNLRTKVGRFEAFSDRLRATIRGNINDFREWKNALDSDGNSIARVLDRITDSVNNLGGGGAGGFGGGFSVFSRGTIWGAIAAAITAALPIIQDIGSAILAYATGLVAQLGNVVTALGGLGAAAGAALGSSLVAIGPIALAFASETEALSDFKAAAKSTGEEFLRIGTVTQATLLPALDEALFQLGELVPLFSEYGFFVGQIVGDNAKYVAQVLTGNVAQERFGDILRSSLNILDKLFPILVDVGDILSGIWVAAIPASERFVDSIGRLVGRWSDLINQGLQSGALTDALDTWYDRSQTLLSALGNLSGALFDILQVGADSSDNVFDRFDEWARGYREFTSSEVGQNRLKLIFDNSLAVMRELNGVVTDLFEGVFGRLGRVGGVDATVEALQGFRDLLPSLKENAQGFIDAIENATKIIVPAVWNKLTEAFDEMKEPLGRLIDQLFDFFRAMQQSGAFDVFLDLMKVLTDVLATLLAIPGFGTFVGYMLAFGSAVKIAAIALAPFAAVIGPFLGAIKTIVTIKAGTQLGAAAGGLAKLTKEVKLLSRLGGGGIAGVFRSIAGGIGPLGALGPAGIAAGVGIAAVGTAFFLAKKRDQEWDQEIRQVSDALGTLNGGLNVAAEGIAKYVQESSRFASRDQIDDIQRLGLSVSDLGEGVANGTIGYTDFADAALRAGEVQVRVSGEYSRGRALFDGVSTSLDALQKKYGLTDDQLEQLSRGQKVYADGTAIVLRGNSSLLTSFEELNKVIGAAAKENIDAFVLDTTNLELLDANVLTGFRDAINDATDEEAALIMRDALKELGEAASESIPNLVGLSDATVKLAEEQVAGLSGPEQQIELYKLLRVEQEKVFKQIRENLDIFASDAFQATPAARAIQDFSEVFNDIDFEKFQNAAELGNFDVLTDQFGDLGTVTYDLFRALESLPEDQFAAAAQALGIEAGSLRDAMDGAAAAIDNLVETALDHLPTIGELLDDATKTDDEGNQFFNEEEFTKSVDERIKNTQEFSNNFRKILREQGPEVAKLALQQGPDAAAAIAELSVGPEGSALTIALERLEDTEQGLRNVIEFDLGPAIADQYLGLAQPLSEGWGIGLANGINSPATLEALRGSSLDTLNYLAEGFQGQFVITPTGRLEFRHTGTFRETQRQTAAVRPIVGIFSQGGFVDDFGVFNNGPSGTDTIPAWLTPGEFVLRRSVAQAIPASVLTSLNNGDSRLIGLLSSIGQNRPGGAGAAVQVGVGGAGAGTPAFGPGSVIVYAQGTSAAEVYREFDSRTNWKLTTRGDQ